MSRGGNPWDNAVVESFNKSLKSELVNKKHPFETREIARKAVFEYIELFYNPKRFHSVLDKNHRWSMKNCCLTHESTLGVH